MASIPPAGRPRRGTRERDTGPPRKVAPCTSGCLPGEPDLTSGSRSVRARHAPAGASPKAGGRRWCRPAARAARRLDRYCGIVRQRTSCPSMRTLPTPADSDHCRWLAVGRRRATTMTDALVAARVAARALRGAGGSGLQTAHPGPSEWPLTCSFSIPRRVKTAFCPCGVRSFAVRLVSAAPLLDHVP